MCTQNNKIMADKIIGIPDEVVLSKIYRVRDQNVMFDFDLAAMYGVETRALKQAVKRNTLRFPDDFMFQPYKARVDGGYHNL